MVYKDAEIEETNPDSNDLVIKNSSFKIGGFNTHIIKNTSLYNLYKRGAIRERHRHTGEINKEYTKLFTKKGLIVSSIREDSDIDSVELSKHKFYIGVQFHPEYTSKPLVPNPIIISFLKNI